MVERTDTRLAVLVIAGAVAAFNWERILALLPSQTTISDKGREEDKDGGQAARKQEGNAGSLTRIVSGPGVKEKNKRPDNPGQRREIRPARRYLPRARSRAAPCLSVSTITSMPIPYKTAWRDRKRATSKYSSSTFERGVANSAQLRSPILATTPGRNAGPVRRPKTVIEKTLTNFLESSRPQDRILVFFIGHAVELGDDVYLAPIEGELDRAETLIPLKWVYEKLAECKARQKVLVLDVNRYNAAFGQERPGSGEMGPKLDALLKAPPAGVQVWSACIAKQDPMRPDDCQMGVFLDSFSHTLVDVMQKNRHGNRIQRGGDPLPLEPYVEWVNRA